MQDGRVHRWEEKHDGQRPGRQQIPVRLLFPVTRRTEMSRRLDGQPAEEDEGPEREQIRESEGKLDEAHQRDRQTQKINTDDVTDQQRGKRSDLEVRSMAGQPFPHTSQRPTPGPSGMGRQAAFAPIDGFRSYCSDRSNDFDRFNGFNHFSRINRSKRVSCSGRVRHSHVRR